MKFKAIPITSLEDVTIDFEQVQAFLSNGDIGVDSTGKLAVVTKVNGATVPLKGSAWIAPTLINSWANIGSGFETAGYLKDPLGFVHLKGTVTGGTAAAAAFVLPAGYRPGATTNNGAGSSTAVTVRIDTGGNVVISASTGTGLSGITFLAEN